MIAALIIIGILLLAVVAFACCEVFWWEPRRFRKVDEARRKAMQGMKFVPPPK